MLPRVAILVPILGVSSQIWILRQCQSFSRIEPVLVGWRKDSGWEMDAGIETHLIRGGFAPVSSPLRRAMHRLGMAAALNPTWRQRRATRKTLQEAQIDAVLCHFAWTAMNAGPALPDHMPMVLHAHGRDVTAKLSSPAYSRMLKRQLGRSAALVAVGQHQLDRIAHLSPPAQQVVIPCGAPHDVFAAGPMPRQEATGPLRFISVGRMAPEKGMKETLQAFEQIAGEFPQAELTLVGFGALEQEIRAAAAASPYADRIRVTGQMSSQQIAQELAASHVYVQHSREIGGWVEGFGVTLAEAGAAGLPLLASASGGLIDQIEEGRNGFLFPEGDILAQATLMRRLALDPALRAELGAAARQLSARFDTRLMVARLEDVILSAIAERGSVASSGRALPPAAPTAALLGEAG